MNVIKRIRQLSVKQLWHLSGVFIKQPFLVFPTLNATKRTMQISGDLYGKAHHKNGPANAFRHALWNVLIAKAAFRKFQNIEKSVDWAEKVTDLHEKLAPNSPLETAMDLHNNEMGRYYFKEIADLSEEKTISFLQKKAKNAQKVTKTSEIEVFEKELVFIEKTS
ncbi:DUF6973 domain-containing protein [Marixanthomonas spongiae]|uniref:DUF6973 domain-containing protein n=1 Tax=Marixanthomonas spongiae TaxID=2174845 RepID=A0A2U0I1V9_9FLAO|nr:hypothetical protein [Marixanthomonas spongiae]PVW15086.1 hypothetical protein DDV96_06675 [Marixanthomonas spongiae]